MRGSNRFTHVLVMAEYGSSGLWAKQSSGPTELGQSMIDAAELRLPTELATRLAEWAEHIWDSYDRVPGFDPAEYDQQGRQLAHALKTQLGPEVRVSYRPFFADNGPDEDISVATG